MYRRRATVEVNKPFKPLVINRPSSKDESTTKRPSSSTSETDSIKKIKVEPAAVLAPVRVHEPAPGQQFRTLKVKPAINIAASESRPISAGNPVTTGNPDTSDQYFEVLWRKSSAKKNKTWDGDGMISISSTKLATLQNTDGKPITKSKLKTTVMEEGQLLRMGFYEVELGSPILREKFISSEPEQVTADIVPLAIPKVFGSTFQAPNLLNAKNSKSGAIRRSQAISTPRHDPKAEGAVVMQRPKASCGKEIVDVVIDPFLSQHLRPHQKEGVQFLYECVMGLREYQGRGAILADEMGLGKTLMTIALIWTLLRQTPYMNETPIVQRALIVCPVTLIANWKKEFRKWLGKERIGIFTLDSKSNLRDFTFGRCYQVMIVGYEKLRSISEDLKKASIDIIICDEGHRLKTSTNKSAQAILTLKTDKRIILSGTPIQNDLGEFFTMVDFLNPGILGTYPSFKRNFEVPIIKSRQPEAMKKDVEKGTLRSEELSQIARFFTLRRTAATLDKYLPPKTDTVLFCRPTSQQISIYKTFLGSNMIRSCMGSNDPSDHLRAITMLKKLCNSPALVKDVEFNKSQLAIPATISISSGKLKVLKQFLHYLYNHSDEKVVIVSGYTQTLDIIEEMLGELDMTRLRLDGSTPTAKRQAMVDKFNKCHQKDIFAFLLSAKSGGAGLNLIGASRLFLFDTDWNPSVDLQAMARVHRDGQKRSVFIYRLLTTGTMDEKIYQRQITKQGLADTFMDGGAASSTLPPSTGKRPLLSVSRDLKLKGGGGKNTFSLLELKDLFSLNTETKSNTHDLLGCDCQSLQDGICVETSPASSSSTPAGRSTSIISTDNEEADESLEQTSDEEGLGGWVTARNVVEGKVPVPKRLRNRENMKGLFEYKHIDPSICQDDEFATGDAVLDELMTHNCPVSYIFTRSTIEPKAL